MLIVVVTLVCTAAGYVYANAKTPWYSATAQLLYEPQLDVSNPTVVQSDAYTQALELDSAKTVIGGADIYERVKESLGASEAWPSYTLDAAVADAADYSGESSNVLNVTADSPNAKWAAKVANAYADEYVAWRIQNDRDRIAAAVTVIEEKLKGFTTPAQKATSDYILLREQLQELEIQSATATGNFRVVTRASTPSAPYAPRPLRTAALAGLVGLVGSLGFAFLRDRLDTSLRSYRDVREVMRMPIVGRIPHIPDESLKKSQLVVLGETDGRAAEALRVLRSNLEFVSLGEENRSLMVVSAQKGEGKSLVTANLAASMALAGKRVALVDADLRRPRVHQIFGLVNTTGVSSVIAGRATLEEALQTYDLFVQTRPHGGNGKFAGQGPADYGATPRLHVLTSGPIPPNPGEMVASRRFTEILERLAAMPFDYVLIDSPAFIPVGDVAALAAHVDGLFLLVNLKMTGRPMLEEAREFLAPLPAHKLGIITVNDQAGGDERYHYYAAR